MHRANLITQLQLFEQSSLCTVEEKHTAAHFIDFVNTSTACFERSNKGHITSSIWIVNAAKTHALLTHHKKFHLWIQLGGHNDGEVDCKTVALKEAEEESGIKGLTFLHEGIFDIDIHTLATPCHAHYDVRYLLQAPENTSYLVSEESHDLAWVPFDQMSTYTLHSSVLRMNEKAKLLLNGIGR
jgi:8-oxo-dGTP pyrophosphatase MutT (NUDIX family)